MLKEREKGMLDRARKQGSNVLMGWGEGRSSGLQGSEKQVPPITPKYCVGFSEDSFP